MSKDMDSDFGERLKKAAEHAGVPFTPQSIASFLEVDDRRKADVWMKGGLPRANKLPQFARGFI